jgi:hypothetical protein
MLVYSRGRHRFLPPPVVAEGADWATALLVRSCLGIWRGNSIAEAALVSGINQLATRYLEDGAQLSDMVAYLQK